MYLRRVSLLLIFQMAILILLQGQKISNGEMIPPPPPPPPPPLPAQNLNIEEIGIKIKNE